MEEGSVLRRWDPQTARQQDFLELLDLESTWQFSPDGQWLASGSSSLSLWNTQTGDRVLGGRQTGWISVLAFSVDGARLASGHDSGKINLWDVETGRLIGSLEGHQAEISALAFSADGAYLASAAEDRVSYIWSISDRRVHCQLEGHTDHVDAMAWSPTNHRLISTGWDTTARVWDPSNGELLALLNGHGECVHCAVFTHDGDRLITGDSDGLVRIWDHEHLAVVATIKTRQAAVKLLAINRSSSQLAVAGLSRVIQFFDLSTLEPSGGLAGPDSEVKTVTASKDGLFAACYAEGTRAVWSIAGDRPLETETSPAVHCWSANSSGRWVAGTGDGQVLTGQLPDLSPMRQWTPHEEPVTVVAMSEDGERCATSSGANGTVKLWNVQEGLAVMVIPTAAGVATVESMVFHPTEPLLVVGGMNLTDFRGGAVRVWDYEEGELVREMPAGATKLAISRSGRLLAAVTAEDTVTVWDLQSGKMVKEISRTEGAVNAICFDQDDAHLFLGTESSGIGVWNMESWSHRATFDVETSVKSLAVVGEDGLISGNGNATCYLIDISDLT